MSKCGIGFDTAAELLITFGDNRGTIRSEAAFVKLGSASGPLSGGSHAPAAASVGRIHSGTASS